jgi:hypothetical protein
VAALGWRRLYIVMRRREGYDVGETRFLRIYRALQLQVRPRKKRKVNYVRGASVQPVTKANERWSIDFSVLQQHGLARVSWTP